MNSLSNKIKLAILGFSLGILFIVLALFLHGYIIGDCKNLKMWVYELKSNEYLWIIQLAPIVLCIAFGYIGKTKDFYTTILDNIPTDIVVFNPNHRYLYVNPYAIKNSKYRRKIIGMDDYEYCAYRNRDRNYAHERRKQFLIAKDMKGGIKWEESIKEANGNIVTNLRGLYPVKDKKGNMMLMIGYAVNISERKHLENKQAVLIQQLTQSNRKLSDFSGIIAHNLRGPIANIASIIDVIETSDDILLQHQLLSYLKPSIVSVSLVLNQLVDSLHVMQDTEIDYFDNSLDECLVNVVNSLHLEIQACRAKLYKKFDTDAMLYGPQKYIISILYNLVSNALKYRSPERLPEITISAEDSGEAILLSVADNGTGIDMKLHGDKLFKIGKVFHDNPGAKGFGLFMTKSQVESMNGKIWAESEPGKGSIFFVQFKKAG